MAVLIKPSEQEQYLDRVLGGDGATPPTATRVLSWREKGLVAAGLSLLGLALLRAADSAAKQS